MRGRRLPWKAIPAAALAGSQLGHLLVYALRLGPEGLAAAGSGAHRYLPTLLTAVAGVGGGAFLCVLVVLGAARFAELLCVHRLWHRRTERDELRQKLARGDDFKLVMCLNEWAFQAKHIPGSIRGHEGSIIMVDDGCTVEGYQSDITRTFVLGKASDKMKKVFDIVHRAQSAGLAAARPGRRVRRRGCCSPQSHYRRWLRS